MTVRAMHRAVLVVGLVGSFAFVFLGTWILVSRVWSTSFTLTLEVLVAAPFFAAWVLSPILWAARPQGEQPESEGGELRALLASTLMVGVGAFAYVSEFVVLPMLFDAEPRRRSLMLVLIVPALQWTIVGAAGALGALRGRSTVGEGPGS